METLSNAPIDVLCVDETKVDSSFLNHQFKTEGYQFLPFRRDRNQGRLILRGQLSLFPPFV